MTTTFYYTLLLSQVQLKLNLAFIHLSTFTLWNSSSGGEGSFINFLINLHFDFFSAQRYSAINSYFAGQKKMSKVDKIYKPKLSRQTLPVFTARISAGFPSPAADYEEGKLDLNKHLIKNPPATFFVRVSGDSMEGAGIHDGDLLIVDRSVEPKSGKVVIAVLNGELTVKRLRISRGKYSLEPENKNYSIQKITKDMEFEVWGVVTNVIHPL